MKWKKLVWLTHPERGKGMLRVERNWFQRLLYPSGVATSSEVKRVNKMVKQQKEVK